MKIGIVGCAGRMGRMLIQEILFTPAAKLSGGTEKAGSPVLGQDLGTLVGARPAGVVATHDTPGLFAASDVVIDFTTAAITKALTEIAAATGKALVIGTTGLDDEARGAIAAAAKKIVIVQAPNMSVGVNALLALTERLAKTLADFDIEIVEMHHHGKVNSPSGTALGLGEAAAKGRGVKLADVARKARDGLVGPRPKGEIGFATLRGGDVIGDHTVIFAGEGERVELSHKATARDVFAKGAVRAALWCKGRPPGLYSMRDVLGL